VLALRQGLRVPGCWDSFELAVRAVLGQQIAVAAARRLARQLVLLCGTSVRSTPGATSLSRAFPTPHQVVNADLTAIAMPAARREALRALATAALDRPELFSATGAIEATVARLRTIRGVGEWTAHYIAMRAFRHADAFPTTDLGLIRGAAAVFGERPTARQLWRRAECWRPWRAYAAQHLWTVDAAARLRGRKLADTEDTNG